MFGRFRLTIAFVLIVLAALIFSPLIYLSSAPASKAQDSGPAAPDRVDMLAAALGKQAGDLSMMDEAAYTLEDGRQILELKALDQTTQEIVGASFIDNVQVDAAQEAAAARQAWRAAHGALTPDLAKKLDAMGPGDRMNVSVWLEAQVEPLPRPVDPPDASAESAFETSAATTSGDEAAVAASQEKVLAEPIPEDQLPPEVLAATGQLAQAGQSITEQGETKAAESATPAQASGEAARAEALKVVEAYKAANDAHIQAQVGSAVANFKAQAAAAGLAPTYSGTDTPLAYFEGLSRKEIETLARLPGVTWVEAVPDQAGESLGRARTTQNAHLINSAGYNGSGVNVAVVEGQRIFAANTYLTVTGFYRAGEPYANHPTAVGGIIRSTHPTVHGLAASSNLYSANGDYSTWSIMSGAIDWGSTNATVLNNSWYWDSSNSAVFWAADRQLDYKVRYNYDFVAVAAGNFGNGCGSNFSTFVVSPAKGYNVLSVGNYDEKNTLGWADDAMDTCSSFGNPGSDTASPTHAKPEVAAVGAVISSTTTSSPWIGGVGSGTSYASPMVAALAADIQSAAPSLNDEPEVVRSIIMATALHNIEGSATSSDKDGVGAIDATAAMTTVERGNYNTQYIDSTTTYPRSYSQFAYKGERVRFVINWLSNPSGAYTTDVMPADLDLYAYRADGTTIVAGSASIANNFEIVDFIAPASETYQFRVTRFGGWTGGGTWLGAGWWRGTYRIGQEIGYSDPKATPLGTHLSVMPSDWPVTINWRVFGIRSDDSDHDLRMYSRNLFDDPALRTLLNGSYFASTGVDFIAVDGNHWNSATQEQYVVNLFSGTGGYDLSRSNLGLNLGSGTYGPYTMGSYEVAKVFDVLFTTPGAKRISIIPVGGATPNQVDLGSALFRSVGTNAATWTKSRSQRVAGADASTAAAATEVFDYIFIDSNADWLGLVVYNKSDGDLALTGRFYINIQNINPLVQYMPITRER